MAPLELLVYVPQAIYTFYGFCGSIAMLSPPADCFHPDLSSPTRASTGRKQHPTDRPLPYRYALPFVRNGIHRRYILGKHWHAPSIKLIPTKNNCLFISIRVLKQTFLIFSSKIGIFHWYFRLKLLLQCTYSTNNQHFNKSKKLNQAIKRLK